MLDGIIGNELSILFDIAKEVAVENRRRRKDHEYDNDDRRNKNTKNDNFYIR